MRDPAGSAVSPSPTSALTGNATASGAAAVEAGSSASRGLINRCATAQNDSAHGRRLGGRRGNGRSRLLALHRRALDGSILRRSLLRRFLPAAVFFPADFFTAPFFTAPLRTAFFATALRALFFAAAFFAGFFLAADFFAVFLLQLSPCVASLHSPALRANSRAFAEARVKVHSFCSCARVARRPRNSAALSNYRARSRLRETLASDARERWMRAQRAEVEPLRRHDPRRRDTRSFSVSPCFPSDCETRPH